MISSLVELDVRGTDYVRGELAATNYLGRIVLSNLDLNQGRTFALVPEQHSPDVYAFRSGIFTRPVRERTVIPGGYMEPVPSTEEDLVQRVYGALSSDARRVFVCESYLLRARDLAKISDLPRRTFAIGEFVYHWALAGDSKVDVAAAVGMVYPVPVGFGLVSLSAVDPARLAADQTVADAELASLCASSDIVFVGAYDGESVVLWLKGSVPI